MRAVSLSILLGVSALASCRTAGSSPGDPSASALLLRGTVVLPDGTTLPDAAVLIEGNRIARVGPASRVPAPRGVRLVGGPGAWIIPGLFDAHVHFFQSGGMYTRPDIVDLTSRVPYANERASRPPSIARWRAT